jgi:hypothetical protein
MPSSVSLGARRTSGAALIREDSYSTGIGTSTSSTKTPSPIKASKGDQYREPPRHHTRELLHREGEGHRQREAAT